MEEGRELICIYVFYEDGDNPVKLHEKLTELYGDFAVPHVMQRNPDAKEPLTSAGKNTQKQTKQNKTNK